MIKAIYRSFLLINVDVKLLNRIISHIILQIFKKIVHYNKLGIFQEYKVDLTFEYPSM